MTIQKSATAALTVTGLGVDVATPDGWAPVVEDVSLEVGVGGCIGGQPSFHIPSDCLVILGHVVASFYGFNAVS